MKLFAAVLSAGLLLMPAAFAQVRSNPLEKVPETVLIDGLTSVTACIRLNNLGITRFNDYVKAHEADENANDDTKKILDEAVASIFAVNKINTTEKNIGMAVIKILVDHYHHSVDELNSKFADIVKDQDAELEDRFKDTDYNGFKDLFLTKEKVCQTVIGKFIDTVEKYSTSVEVQQ